MKLILQIIGAVCLVVAAAAHANNFTATVDTMQVDLAANGGYVRLTGLPTFDGTGCTSPWAAGSLDDDKFMTYIWPTLLSAKNRGVSVTVAVSGCIGPYPKILWIQVNPS